MNDLTTLGDRLHYLRVRKKLSAVKTAGLVGVTSPNTIYGYEKNNREPELKILNEYAQKFNVNISWIITGKEPIEPTERLLNYVSESQHHYGSTPFVPVVSKVSASLYNPADEVRKEKVENVKASCFFLLMPDNSLQSEMEKSIKQGDLLMIDPTIKEFYPGDLMAVVTYSGRQWIKFIEIIENSSLQLQGGIKLKKEEIAGMYRVIRVRPAEFDV